MAVSIAGVFLASARPSELAYRHTRTQLIDFKRAELSTDGSWDRYKSPWRYDATRAIKCLAFVLPAWTWQRPTCGSPDEQGSARGLLRPDITRGRRRAGEKPPDRLKARYRFFWTSRTASPSPRSRRGASTARRASRRATSATTGTTTASRTGASASPWARACWNSSPDASTSNF